MDRTPIYGFPWPECEPPLVKDASDIDHLENLAAAIDAQVEALNLQANDELIVPDICRVFMGAAAATSEAELTAFTDTLSWQTAGSGMADLANGGIRIQEQGWYIVGAFTEVSVTAPAATQLALRMAIVRNGVVASNFQDSGRIVTGDFQYGYTSEVMNLSSGDLIQARNRHGAGGGITWTYRTRLWAVQILAT
jgi:hypothetical protein